MNSIENNRAENAIRPFVVGRMAFSDSPKGASASAMLYSLVVSAKMNGLNAENYLIRLFRSPDFAIYTDFMMKISVK